MIATIEQISTKGITDAQLGACHKVIHTDGNYYLVENSKGELDPETGYIKEYKVSWSKARGFQCQCEAAYHGKICWHIRASVACEREVKQAVAELEAAIKEQAAPVASSAPALDTATRARIEAANERQAGKVSKAKANDPRPFSLLR